MAIDPEALLTFEAICERERCPFAGRRRDGRRPARGRDDRAGATGGERIDMPMDVLPKPPRCTATARACRRRRPLDPTGVGRGPGGARRAAPPGGGEQELPRHHRRPHGRRHDPPRPMVGPWQVPVADCAVTLADDSGGSGWRGDGDGRTHAAAHAGRPGGRPRLAVAEAMTNLLAAPDTPGATSEAVRQLDGRCGEPGEDAALFDTVRAVAMELARRWHRDPGRQGQPVDATRGTEGDAVRQVTAPVSLIVTAFATLDDVRQNADAAAAARRYDADPDRPWRGGSAWVRLIRPRRLGVSKRRRPDLDDPALLRRCSPPSASCAPGLPARAPRPQRRRAVGHAVCEMAFAGHRHANVDLLTEWRWHRRQPRRRRRFRTRQVGERRNDLMLRRCSTRSSGVVIQVARPTRHGVRRAARARPGPCSHVVGKAQRQRHGRGLARRQAVLSVPLRDLQQAWDEVSWRIARLRDHPACADSEHAAAGAADDPGLHVHLTFDAAERVAAPFVHRAGRGSRSCASRA